MNLAEELKREGIQEGKTQKAMEVAINMLKKGMEVGLIAEVTELSEEEIKRLNKSNRT